MQQKCSRPSPRSRHTSGRQLGGSRLTRGVAWPNRTSVLKTATSRLRGEGGRRHSVVSQKREWGRHASQSFLLTTAAAPAAAAHEPQPHPTLAATVRYGSRLSAA